MICAPVIALVELATGGMLTSAIGGVLGSQILGGAVVGLIASGGKPEGALFGALGGALSGASGSGSLANPAPEGGSLIDEAGKAVQGGASSSSGASLEGVMDDYGNPLADSLKSAGERGASTGAAQGGSSLASDSSASGASIQNRAPIGVKDVAAPAIRDIGIKDAGGGIMSRFSNFAENNKELMKIGLGAIQGGAQISAQKSMLDAQKQNAIDTQNRAYVGADTTLPWQVAKNNAQLTPMQRYQRGIA